MTRAKAAIALLPALLVAADYFAARWSAAHRDYTHPATIVLLALVSSQLGLMGVWFGLSRRAWWVRLAVTVLGVAGLVLALVCACTFYQDREWTSDTALALAVPLVVVMVLQILRWRARLTLVWRDPSTRAACKPLQFSTSHLLLGVTAVAILLGVVPWLADQPISRYVPPRFAIGLFSVLVTLTSAWASLGRGRALARLAVLVPAASLLAFAMIWPARMATLGPRDPLSLATAVVAGLSTLFVSTALLLFRLFGYRLARIAPPWHATVPGGASLPVAVIASFAVATLTLFPDAWNHWRRWRAARTIVAANGYVLYENGRVTYAQLSDDKAALQSLALLTELKRLECSGSGFTDRGLVPLAALPHLKFLDLYGTRVTLEAVERLQHARPSLRVSRVPNLTPGDWEAIDAMRELGADVYISNQVSVDIRSGSADAILQQVARLSKIDGVTCVGRDVTDLGLKHLRKQTNLFDLSLTKASVTDAGLEQLAGMKRLRYLRLRDCPISGRGLAHLKGLTGLINLSLRDSEITDEGLSHVSALTKLEELDLSNTRITGAGLKHLAAMTSLEKLDLTGSAVTDQGLENLASATTIRELSLAGTQVSDDGLAHLSALVNLDTLNLSNTKVTGPGVSRLRTLRRLRDLNLSNSEVTDGGLAKVQWPGSLYYLDLSGTAVSDAALEPFAALANLGSLDVRGTRVTRKGSKNLRRAVRRALHISGAKESTTPSTE